MWVVLTLFQLFNKGLSILSSFVSSCLFCHGHKITVTPLGIMSVFKVWRWVSGSCQPQAVLQNPFLKLPQQTCPYVSLARSGVQYHPSCPEDCESKYLAKRNRILNIALGYSWAISWGGAHFLPLEKIRILLIRKKGWLTSDTCHKYFW